jgi:hypothetical protein
MLVREVGVRRRNGLKLDERPELLDVIEMYADAPPQQQMAALGDDPAYADRGGERFGSVAFNSMFLRCACTAIPITAYATRLGCSRRPLSQSTRPHSA